MRNTITILVLLFLCACSNSAGDKSAGKATDENEAINRLIDQALKSASQNPKLSDSLGNVVLQISTQKNYKKGIAYYYFIKSNLLQDVSNYDSAIQLARTSLDLFTEINYPKGIARSHNSLGINYDFLGNHPEAIRNYLAAQKIFEEQGDTAGAVNVYNNIGIIHENQGNYNQAIQNYRQAMAKAIKAGYLDGELSAKNGLGSTYIEIGNYDSALTYFNDLLNTDLKSGNETYISYSYNNVGEAYLGLGNYNKALVCFEKSKALKEKLGNRAALANTLKNIGDTYLRLKEYPQAKQNLEQAATLAQELSIPETAKDAYMLLHELSKNTGDFETALLHYKKAEKIADELSLDKKQATISRLERDFEIEKAGKKLLLAQNQNKVARLRNIGLVVIVILLLVLAGALFLGLRYNKKRNKVLLEYQEKLELQNAMLEESNKIELAQKRQLEAALSARSRFLSFMSHEIRTPLNGIMGLVDLLQTQAMLDEQKEFIDALKHSADNLMLLLNNILDLSKLESGNIVLENGEVDLRQIFEEQKLLFKGIALLKKNELKTFVADTVPLKLEGDPYRLAQIFSNLINNALKFTKNGQIEIKAQIVSKDYQKTKIYFEVSDSGIGIAAHQLQEIMLPFSQAEGYTTRKYGGSGLGLTIVTLLLKAMNSELKVESQLGNGSRFCFELDMPIIRPIIFTENNEYNATGIEGLEGKKILVVEDNTTNILLLTKILAGWRTEYDVADNGYKAIEYAKAKQYDIVLMDLHLPKISGYETAEKIKAIPQNSQTPILAITAADMLEIKNNPQHIFLNEIIFKPVKPLVLLTAIQKLLHSGQ